MMEEEKKLANSLCQNFGRESQIHFQSELLGKQSLLDQAPSSKKTSVNLPGSRDLLSSPARLSGQAQAK
jgi:hypothetical protein